MTNHLRAKQHQKDTKKKGQPANEQGVVELTEQDLEQVQGGFGASNPADTGYPNAKIPPGPSNYEWVK